MKKYRRKAKDVIVEAILFTDPEKLPKGVTPHPNEVDAWAYQSATVGGNTCILRRNHYLIYTEEGTCVAWPKAEFEAHFEEVGAKPAAKKAPAKKKALPMSRSGGPDASE